MRENYPQLTDEALRAAFAFGDPIGACFRHTVDPFFNLLVPR